MPRTALLVTLAATLFAVPTTSQAALTLYDLASDWSDAQNPNGVWAYELGGVPAPATIRTGDTWSTPQPMWGIPDSHVGWSRSNGTEQFSSPPDWQAGDVFVHTNDVDTNDTTVSWTSPSAGTIDLTLALWMARDIGRSVHWKLMLDGALVAEGDLSSGDPYDSGNPLEFQATALPVAAGAVLRLDLDETSFGGDYVVVDLGVALTSSQGLLGPSPYLCFDSADNGAGTETAGRAPVAGCGGDESPFALVDFSGGFFYLEDFEDGVLDTPGVVGTGGSVLVPDSTTDSVAEDDDGDLTGPGDPDAAVPRGHSYQQAVGQKIVFSFDEASLGRLPTHVGIVATDVAEPVPNTSFEVFGPGGAPLASFQFSIDFGAGPNDGTASRDRFIGFVAPAGISEIRVGCVGSGCTSEWDHLQYGAQEMLPAIPALDGRGLGLLGLVSIASLGLVSTRRRPRHSLHPPVGE